MIPESQPQEADRSLSNADERSMSHNTISLRCRICLDSSSMELLITPCLCTGTMGLLHKSCLEAWLTSSQATSCEICGFTFETLWKCPTFKDWFFRGGTGSQINKAQRKHLRTDFICLIILMCLIGIFLWQTIKASKRLVGRDYFNWELFSFACILLMLTFLCSFWFCISIRYHYNAFKAWTMKNRQICLTQSFLSRNAIKNHGAGQQDPHLIMATNNINNSYEQHFNAIMTSSTPTEVKRKHMEGDHSIQNDGFEHFSPINPDSPPIAQITNSEQIVIDKKYYLSDDDNKKQ